MWWRQNNIAWWVVGIIFFLIFFTVIIWISLLDYGDCSTAISDCRNRCQYSGVKNVLCPVYIRNFDNDVISASKLRIALNLQSNCADAIVTLQERCGCHNWRCWNNREPAAPWIVLLVVAPLCLFAVFCTVDIYNRDLDVNQAQTCRQISQDKVGQASLNVNTDASRAWRTAKAFDL